MSAVTAIRVGELAAAADRVATTSHDCATCDPIIGRVAILHQDGCPLGNLLNLIEDTYRTVMTAAGVPA